MAIEQNEVAKLIDLAVDCWHEVADEHEQPHCNCFREKFARRLIDAGIFVGYDKLENY